MAARLLEIIRLQKSYRIRSRHSPVLEGLTFSLGYGEILVLLGVSGSGKSTLLRMLAGLEQPDSGRILSAVARPGPALSYLPQGETLHPWRTAGDNLQLAFSLRGKKRTKETFAEALHLLAEVGMEGYGAAFPAALSGGMTQRVLLARALLTNPQLLLLDEPFSQLDVVARRELATVLRSYVRRRGASAILVTHSLEEALAVADRVIVLTRSPARVSRTFAMYDAASTDSTALTRSEGFPALERALFQSASSEQSHG